VNVDVNVIVAADIGGKLEFGWLGKVGYKHCKL